MNALATATLVVSQFLLPGAAYACRAEMSERYLIWFDKPPLSPGEIAVEIDIADFVENRKLRTFSASEYKVKRVLVGKYEGDRILVQREGNSCEREAASGSSSHLVLVGTLLENPDGTMRLLPRYMDYDDPIRVNARQSLEDTTADR